MERIPIAKYVRDNKVVLIPTTGKLEPGLYAVIANSGNKSSRLHEYLSSKHIFRFTTNRRMTVYKYSYTKEDSTDVYQVSNDREIPYVCSDTGITLTFNKAIDKSYVSGNTIGLFKLEGLDSPDILDISIRDYTNKQSDTIHIKVRESFWIGIDQLKISVQPSFRDLIDRLYLTISYLAYGSADELLLSINQNNELNAGDYLLVEITGEHGDGGEV